MTDYIADQDSFTLDDILSIYNFKFYYDTEHYNFVRDIRINQLRQLHSGEVENTQLPHLYIPAQKVVVLIF